jgi:hypothetical protein
VQTRPSSDREKDKAEASLSPNRAQDGPIAEDNPGSRDDASATARRRWATKAGWILGALLLALAILPSPRIPTGVDEGVVADASWSAVLQYAHEHKLQFGRDIVFTYGPLGYLGTPYAFWDTQMGLRLATDFFWSFLSGLGVCLIARRAGPIGRVVLIGVYLFLLGNIYPRTDLLVELNLLFWGLLCIVAHPPNLMRYLAILAGAAVFASLVKITLFVMAVLTIGVVTCDLLLRKQHRYGGALLALAALGFMGGWMGASQHLSNLAAFLGRALATSQGYNAAMGYEGSVELRRRAILTGVLAAATVLATACRSLSEEARFRKVRQALMAAWTFCMLFLVWKHGFVRTDPDHAGLFFGFAPLLALTLAALFSHKAVLRTPCVTPETPRDRQAKIKIPFQWLLHSPRSSLWSEGFAACCCLVSLVTLQTMILPGDWTASLLQPFAAIRQNVSSLATPVASRQKLAIAADTERQNYQLPRLREIIGHSSVDMFGCEQISLLANDLNYRPRPVFQSYAAYSAPLMRWNEAFYQSAAAPQYVLFRLRAIDRKFPPLEDSHLLKHLLINYELVASEGALLLLRAKGNEPAEMRLLREGNVQAGEPINLLEFGSANLWLELDLTETMLGRLRHFFYQPAKSRLAVWSASPGGEKVRRFRAPAPMLAAGFLISPAVLDNQGVLGLYRGAEPTRASACSIEFNPGDEKFWQQTIQFRLYKVQNTLGQRTSGDP